MSDERLTRKLITRVGDFISRSIPNEITGIAEKTTLTGNDLFLLEDSADGYTKKRVKYSNVYTYSAASAVGARVYNDANISVSNGASGHALTFNSETRDDGGCHSTLSNTSRLTVPTGGAGWYTIWGNVEWDTNSGGNRELWILVDATTEIAHVRMPPCSSGKTLQQVTALYYLTAAQYIELWAKQSTSGALDVVAASRYSPDFGFVKVV